MRLDPVLENFSRPYGTSLAEDLYPALRAGLSSAVPAGLGSNISLADRWFLGAVHSSSSRVNLDKAEVSAVPTGLVLLRTYTQHCMLG
jgi:hypothetical protein